MPLRRLRTLVLPLAFAIVAASALAAGAIPTCTEPGTTAACGGRIVAEPENSTTFLQYDGASESLLEVLEAIEALSPDFVEVLTMGEATGTPDAYRSAGGREIYVVRLTDEAVPREGKRQVAVSLSIHGLEPAGREGGIRYVEDLARWSVTEPDRPLYSGENAFPVSEVLARTEVWVGFLNPDGWAAGDFMPNEESTAGPVGFNRENANNADLNRDFATLGWVDRRGTRGLLLSEPEAQGWDALLRGFPNLTTATDIHGEVTSLNNAFSDLLWPAGVWGPARQAQELQLARNMIATVERKFEEEGVVLADIFGPAVGQTPANVATGYDVVGYDDSGFLGDAMTQLDVVEIDVENFLSNLVPNNIWVPAIEQAHVAAVRGNMESIIVEALVTDQVQPSLDLGNVAYVFDPAVVTSADGTGFAPVEGETQVPYEVSRMQYFTDLARDAGVPVTPLSSGDVATADLSAFDSIVLADVAVPQDTGGRPVDRAAYAAALDRFTQAGGQVVLTDGAVELLADLGVVAEGDLTLNRTNAGHVDFGETDHPFEQDLFGVPSQTYYEVPLGFTPRNPSTAPHHGVTPQAWEGAGGVTVGTVSDEDGDNTNVVLGEVARGEGRIAIFGAILPTAVETLTLENGQVLDLPHPQGLAPYAVTIAGGQVLANILEHRDPTPEPVPSPGPPPPSPAPSPDPGVEPVVDRLSGEDRFQTAAEVSAASFSPGVEVAYVATGGDFPDALSGGAAAATQDGPVLLVTRDSLPAATAGELERLQPQRLVLLGGTEAVSAEVERRLNDVAPVERIGGQDRFATAALVSQETFSDGADVAYVATGAAFPDALAGSAAAAAEGAPVLLVTRDSVPRETAAELERLGLARVVVLGGPDAVSEDTADELGARTQAEVVRRAGADRYETAAAVSEALYSADATSVAFLATGRVFPDALTAVPAAAALGAPVLLAEPDALPAATASELRRLDLDRVVLLGGEEALAESVADEVRNLLAS